MGKSVALGTFSCPSCHEQVNVVLNEEEANNIRKAASDPRFPTVQVDIKCKKGHLFYVEVDGKLAPRSDPRVKVSVADGVESKTKVDETRTWMDKI
jgi:hypothetical protein